MPLFQLRGGKVMRSIAERPGIEQPVGGVEHPHGYEHGGYRDRRQSQAAAAGDEPRP
jgi:hypothetical protein